jgi:NADH:ubiquinone oxidoreductase subunit 5 (subunit L)/multisubunit Na+/H+ antiporter MnhA subunit
MVIVILDGGLLAATYVFRVLRQAFLLPPSGERRRFAKAAPLLEWTAFALAAASVLVGLRGMEIVALLGTGGAL